ncbi:MAG: DMT family transporter [Chromatiales bacterium]|nr:DMT family transporter [Chromatiales bacterium]
MKTSPYLLLTLTSLFWAGNFVIARAVHADIPPISLAFWRWTIALMILLPFVTRHIISQRTLLLQNWKRIVLLSMLGVAGFNTFIYLGVQYTSATNALLLNSFIPMLTIIITWLFQGQHLSMKQIFGVIISIFGVATIISRGDINLLSSMELNYGDMLVMVAVIFWAIYTTVLKGLPHEINRLGFMGVIALLGVLMLTPFYLWELSLDSHTELTSSTLLTFAYVGLFPSVLAMLFYNRGVVEVGPAKASLFIHLMPVFGTVMSILFLNEIVQSFHLIGIGLIFTGIYFSLIRS